MGWLRELAFADVQRTIEHRKCTRAHTRGSPPLSFCGQWAGPANSPCSQGDDGTVGSVHGSRMSSVRHWACASASLAMDRAMCRSCRRRPFSCQLPSRYHPRGNVRDQPAWSGPSRSPPITRFTVRGRDVPRRAIGACRFPDVMLRALSRWRRRAAYWSSRCLQARRVGPAAAYWTRLDYGLPMRRRLPPPRRRATGPPRRSLLARRRRAFNALASANAVRVVREAGARDVEVRPTEPRAALIARFPA